MKNLVCLWVALILGSTVVFGCENWQLRQELDDSRATFALLKIQAGGDYEYWKSTSSWTGYQSTTTITVVDSRVSERHCWFGGNYDDGSESPSGEWSETGDTLNTHDECADAVVFEALYDECENDILSKDPDDGEITLEFGADGTLRTCTFRPHDCIDDCDHGVEVDGLTFGEND